MQIVENTTNEQLMERERTAFDDAVDELADWLTDYKRGYLAMLDVSDKANEVAARLEKAATFHKIAELAYQLEQKYGKE